MPWNRIYMSHHVGAGNHTWVLAQAYINITTEPSLRPKGMVLLTHNQNTFFQTPGKGKNRKELVRVALVESS